MHTFRTVLEQKIKERRLTLLEFVDYAETFAREHKESGTLSLRHLQRLVAGHGPKGQPLGQLRPATIRLLENIFGRSIEELLAPPIQPSHTDSTTDEPGQTLHASGRTMETVTIRPPRQIVGIRKTDHQLWNIDTPTGQAGHPGVDFAKFFDWLDEHAGWIPDTTRLKVMSRLAKMNLQELIDQHGRRARVSCRQIANALSEYYGGCLQGTGFYGVRLDNKKIATSIATRPDWLDIACHLGQDNDQLTLIKIASDGLVIPDELSARHAVRRLAEAAALKVRIANMPVYRLSNIEVSRGSIRGTVGLAPFAEYALTMDLLEGELVEAITVRSSTRHGSLPLRDRYLPDLASVFDVSARLCAGGALALCAIARPFDRYRGVADYALLIQQRSNQVLNATRRLAVIPKGFHEPLTDYRADAQIGATLRREMEEELFGRTDVDSTVSERRAAAPMHPDRLSVPIAYAWSAPDSG
ncbi:MAG: hypothetical protein LC775_00665 [Acidobacteria bacterium]|nr:hypothetical protein [Acidobacteriota bacterium]